MFDLLAQKWGRKRFFTGPQKYLVFGLLWSFNYFYWTNIFFTSHGIRTGVFHIDC